MIRRGGHLFVLGFEGRVVGVYLSKQSHRGRSEQRVPKQKGRDCPGGMGSGSCSSWGPGRERSEKSS